MTDKKRIFNGSQIDQLGLSWSRMVNCIVHDLTTPLATLKLTGESLENDLPTLIEGYKLAVKNNLIKADLTEEDVEYIQTSVPEIKEDITYISNFLKSLYPYQQKIFLSQDTKPVNIRIILEDVLKKYHFIQEAEKSLFHIDFAYDFEFLCDSIFIEYLFYNLFYESLNHIKQIGKGEIKIWAREEHHYHILHFQDTAGGLSEDGLARVFNRFFIKHDNEIIPGLGFCRLAFLQRGGNILCDSPKEEYIDFIIQFPKETEIV